MLFRPFRPLSFAASILVAVAATVQSVSRTSVMAVPSPYVPSSGWTYAIEAIRSSPWPACPYRFLSFSESCNSVDLWRAVGSNQFWTLESASSADSHLFYIRASCGSYLRCICFNLYRVFQIYLHHLTATLLIVALTR